MKKQQVEALGQPMESVWNKLNECLGLLKKNKTTAHYAERLETLIELYFLLKAPEKKKNSLIMMDVYESLEQQMAHVDQSVNKVKLFAFIVYAY